jgi:membrane protease YdiL (CAAX protease family)
MAVPGLDGNRAWMAIAGALLLQVLVARWTGFVFGVSETSSPALLLSVYLVLPAGCGIFWVWFIVVWREPGGWLAVGFARPGAPWMRQAVFVGVAALLIGMLIVNLLAPVAGKPSALLPDLLSGREPRLIDVFMLIAGVCVAAPLMEEILFRGLMFGWLRQRLPIALSATIAAFAHSAIHFDPAAMLPLAAIFVLFGFLYERTGTLWAPIVAHGLHNALSLAYQFTAS